MANDEFDLLRNGPVPTPRDSARERALEAALSAYDLQNTSAATQGTASGHRLTERAWRLWSEMMNKKMYATPAIAGLLALPIAGYTTYYMMKDLPFAFDPENEDRRDHREARRDRRQEGRDRAARAHRTDDCQAGHGRAAEGRRRTTRANCAATSPPTCWQNRKRRRPRSRLRPRRPPSRISTPRAIWRRPSR